MSAHALDMGCIVSWWRLNMVSFKMRRPFYISIWTQYLKEMNQVMGSVQDLKLATDWPLWFRRFTGLRAWQILCTLHLNKYSEIHQEGSSIIQTLWEFILWQLIFHNEELLDLENLVVIVESKSRVWRKLGNSGKALKMDWKNTTTFPNSLCWARILFSSEDLVIESNIANDYKCRRLYDRSSRGGNNERSHSKPKKKTESSMRMQESNGFGEKHYLDLGLASCKVL